MVRAETGSPSKDIVADPAPIEYVKQKFRMQPAPASDGCRNALSRSLATIRQAEVGTECIYYAMNESLTDLKARCRSDRRGGRRRPSITRHNQPLASAAGHAVCRPRGPRRSGAPQPAIRAAPKEVPGRAEEERGNR